MKEPEKTIPWGADELVDGKWLYEMLDKTKVDAVIMPGGKRLRVAANDSRRIQLADGRKMRMPIRLR